MPPPHHEKEIPSSTPRRFKVMFVIAWDQRVTTHDIRCKKGLDNRLISLISCLRILQFFKCFTLWRLSTDIWLILRSIQLTFFLNIQPKSARYLIEIWSIFSWCPFIIPKGWYPWYPDIRCTGFPASCYPLHETMKEIHFCTIRLGPKVV